MTQIVLKSWEQSQFCTQIKVTLTQKKKKKGKKEGREGGREGKEKENKRKRKKKSKEGKSEGITTDNKEICEFEIRKAILSSFPHA